MKNSSAAFDGCEDIPITDFLHRLKNKSRSCVEELINPFPCLPVIGFVSVSMSNAIVEKFLDLGRHFLRIHHKENVFRIRKNRQL